MQFECRRSRCEERILEKKEIWNFYKTRKQSEEKTKKCRRKIEDVIKKIHVISAFLEGSSWEFDAEDDDISSKNFHSTSSSPFFVVVWRRNRTGSIAMKSKSKNENKFVSSCFSLCSTLLSFDTRLSKKEEFQSSEKSRYERIPVLLDIYATHHQLVSNSSSGGYVAKTTTSPFLMLIWSLWTQSLPSRCGKKRGEWISWKRWCVIKRM